MSAEIVFAGLIILAKKLAIEYIPKKLKEYHIPERLSGIVLETTLVALQDEQRYISSDEKLDRLIGIHYKNGTDFLSDAKRLQGERREGWITKALWEFNSASNVEKEPLQQIKSQFFVGVCYDLLNENPLAMERYEKAYRAASQLATQGKYRPRQLAQLQLFIDSLSEVLRAHGSTLGIPQKTSLEHGVYGGPGYEFTGMEE